MGRMSRISVCTGFAAFTLRALAQTAAMPHSIDDLVSAALERNGEYLATAQRIREAEGLLRQAGVRPNPTVEIETAQGRALGSEGESEYTAGYFQPIETGGKRS